MVFEVSEIILFWLVAGSTYFQLHALEHQPVVWEMVERK